MVGPGTIPYERIRSQSFGSFGVILYARRSSITALARAPMDSKKSAIAIYGVGSFDGAMRIAVRYAIRAES